MRDAAAKFLTQFPALEVAKPLLAVAGADAEGQPLPGFAGSGGRGRRHDDRSGADQRLAGGGGDGSGSVRRLPPARLRRGSGAFSAAVADGVSVLPATSL